MHLYALIAELLNIDEEKIDSKTGPKTLGEWDSHAHFNIIMALEEIHSIKFSPQEIQAATNIGELEKILKNKGIG